MADPGLAVAAVGGVDPAATGAPAWLLSSAGARSDGDERDPDGAAHGDAVNALDATGICNSKTAHRRFQEWREAGVLDRSGARGF